MRVIDADAIDRALAFPALIDALAEAFRGSLVAPERHHHGIERPGREPGTLLIMPAWGGLNGFIGVKVATIFPDNGALGLPSLFGSYLLMEGATGRPLAVLDGARLTLWRTAAASALAARALARPDARRMAMVGAGALAPFLIRAHRSQRPIEEVALWNRNPERAEALADTMRREGLPVWATADLESAVRAADIVSCATLSAVPLIRGAWLKPGSHLDLVGAFHPGAREADDAALRRASVYVDTPSALTEGVNVAVGLQAGAIDAADVRGDLFGLCRGTTQGRARPDEITLFKSVGAAIEDLAAAALAWKGLT
jgi:ornithine cyclodeaminase/alanine dehydrogenase-like protein (mu-crystallin family)